MSDFVSAVAIHTVQFTNVDGLADTRSRGDAPFRISTTQFDELAALGAVRRATKTDAVSPLDHDLDGLPGGAAPAPEVELTAKVKGKSPAASPDRL